MSDVLKDAFALALLRNPNDPFKAALSICHSSQKALQIASEWLSDLGVLQRQAELLEEQGEDAFLPSKAMTARRIFDLAEGANDRKDKIAAYKLYAELRGFIDKGGTSINNNLTVNNNRVMIMKDHGTDDQWEARASEHQMKLVEHARD